MPFHMTSKLIWIWIFPRLLRDWDQCELEPVGYTNSMLKAQNLTINLRKIYIVRIMLMLRQKRSAWK